MSNKITPTGKMSKEELVKSSRDAILVAISTLIPTLLSFIEATDFGELNFVVAGVLAMITPFLNRFFNFLRV